MSPTRTTPKRSLAIGSAFAVAVALGLSGCGEYSPVAPEKEKPPAAQRDEDSRDDAHRTNPEQPDVPGGIPDAAPPTSPPSADAQQPGSGGGTTPGSRQGGGGGSGGNGGSGGSGGSGGGGSGGNGGQPEPRVYAWGLPLSDTSPNDFLDGPAYAKLAGGDCDGAAGYLSAENLTNDPKFGVFHMKTPRYVVLLSAGVAMCRSAFDEARASYLSAMNQWGTQGLDNPSHPFAGTSGGARVTPPWRRGYREPECDLYRALTYSLTGVAADSLQCPGGLRPVHHYVEYTTVILVETETPGVFEKREVKVIVWDNPLTSDDESLTPPEHWNSAPGTPGTSPEEGRNNTGDPDDEFDVPPAPPDADADAPAEVGAEAAGAVAGAEELTAAADPVEPAAADAAAVEPAAIEHPPVEGSAPEPAPGDAEPAEEQPEAEASVPAAEPPAPPAEPATPPETAEPPATPPAESEVPAPPAP